MTLSRPIQGANSKYQFKSEHKRFKSDSYPKENVTYKETRINPISYETAIRPVIQDSNPNLVSSVVIEILTRPFTVAPFSDFFNVHPRAEPNPPSH